MAFELSRVGVRILVSPVTRSNLPKVTCWASIFSFVKWVVVIIREDNVI